MLAGHGETAPFGGSVSDPFGATFASSLCCSGFRLSRFCLLRMLAHHFFCACAAVG